MATANVATQQNQVVCPSAQTPTYQYKPLQEDRSIRILDLDPAAANDAPLRASLREVALSDDPEYEAISYAWGTAVFTTPLELPDGVMYITESLASGLRRFRLFDKSRP